MRKSRLCTKKRLLPWLCIATYCGARLGWRGPGQRGQHVAASLCLPVGIHDSATLVADNCAELTEDRKAPVKGMPASKTVVTLSRTHTFVVPNPGFGVDGLAHARQNAQGRQVVLAGEVVPETHQGANGRWR